MWQGARGGGRAARARRGAVLPHRPKCGERRQPLLTQHTCALREHPPYRTTAASSRCPHPASAHPSPRGGITTRTRCHHHAQAVSTSTASTPPRSQQPTLRCTLSLPSCASCTPTAASSSTSTATRTPTNAGAPPLSGAGAGAGGYSRPVQQDTHAAPAGTRLLAPCLSACLPVHTGRLHSRAAASCSATRCTTARRWQSACCTQS